jgi:hypothetical protein
MRLAAHSSTLGASACGNDPKDRVPIRNASVFSNAISAQQGARANDHVRHASCWRRSRAGRARGSSLTFGNISRAVAMTASESIRFRGLAGTGDKTGVRFMHGRREAVAVAADRGREFSDVDHDGGRHAGRTVSSVQSARGPSGPEAPAAISALGATRRHLLSRQFGTFPFRRLGPPNKAPEPTITSVTSPAFAGAAPAAIVAHL